MLNGRLAVVTGGASGIGAACCLELARLGAKVVVVDRSEKQAREVAAQCGGFARILDVGIAEDIQSVAAEIEEVIGAADILVNSAGIIQLPVAPDRLAVETWDDIVRVDQRGTYLSCVAFGTRMAARRRGSIVNIASIAGMHSMPLHAYSPAKAAVISMTACLAAEWGPSQVRVNAVSPGYTLTPVIQGAIDRGERDVRQLERNSALGRLVNPAEIASAVAFLCTAAASAITGVNLPVDCGASVAMSWGPYGGVRAAATGDI